MLNRRDFDEWLARETARVPSAAPSLSEKDWAYRAFMASQVLIRKQVQRANMREVNQQTAALLKRANEL